MREAMWITKVTKRREKQEGEASWVRRLVLDRDIRSHREWLDRTPAG